MATRKRKQDVENANLVVRTVAATLIAVVLILGVVFLWPGPQIAAGQAESAARVSVYNAQATQIENLNKQLADLKSGQSPATQVPPAIQPVATSAPASTEVPAPANDQVVTGNLPSDLFLTPVKCTASFNSASSWLICEPGVLLDNTTAWTIPSTKDTYYSDVPEGGFAYYSLGQGTITVDGVALDLPYIEGHNYLVIVRGRIDDGKVNTDRNITAEVTNFVPGHAIYSYMPKGAYVSKDWFKQQLVASTTQSYTNCGALGCSKVTVVLFDVDTHFEQRFEVDASNLDNWTLVK